MAAIVGALNPLGLIAQLVKDHRLNEWLKLGISLAFSGLVSFLFTCGSALAAHRPAWEALGIGMVMSAVMMTVTWRRSPLTRGLIVALPAEEAAKELDSNIQVISK